MEAISESAPSKLAPHGADVFEAGSQAQMLAIFACSDIRQFNGWLSPGLHSSCFPSLEGSKFNSAVIGNASACGIHADMLASTEIEFQPAPSSVKAAVTEVGSDGSKSAALDGST